MKTSQLESFRQIERVDGVTGTRIQSVSRACQILLWLAKQREGGSAKEVAFATQLALPTTYHLLNTLTDQGMVVKNAQRRYIIGHGAAVIARAYLRHVAVSEGLLSTLHILAGRTRETACVTDWCGADIRILASIEGTQLRRVAEDASDDYRHAHARANGKVLLAFAEAEVRDAYLDEHPLSRLTDATIHDRRELDAELDRIRCRGYAYDNESYAEGVSCVAAPLLESGRLIAAFGVSVPTERFRNARQALTDELVRSIATVSMEPGVIPS